MGKKILLGIVEKNDIFGPIPPVRGLGLSWFFAGLVCT